MLGKAKSALRVKFGSATTLTGTSCSAWAEKSASRLQNLIGTPQILDRPLQGLDAFALAAGQSIGLAAVDLLALEPFQQGLRHAADLRCNGLNGSSSRGALASVVLNQPHRTLPDLW